MAPDVLSAGLAQNSVMFTTDMMKVSCWRNLFRQPEIMMPWKVSQGCRISSFLGWLGGCVGQSKGRTCVETLPEILYVETHVGNIRIAGFSHTKPPIPRRKGKLAHFFVMKVTTRTLSKYKGLCGLENEIINSQSDSSVRHISVSVNTTLNRIVSHCSWLQTWHSTI